MINNLFFNKNTKSKSGKKPGFGNEILKEELESTSSQAKYSSPDTPRLSGELKKGQSVEFNPSWNHLVKEQALLFDSRQNELKTEINNLLLEIKQLVKVTDNLEKDVVNAVAQPIVEPSTYQVNFLKRLVNFIKNVRKNINQASQWMESFQTKKRKKNFFWSQVKSKKGGEQYLFSGEHSAARSAV